MTSLLKQIERFVSYAAILTNVIGTLVVLGLVAVVNYEVVLRGLYNKSFHGAVELVQFSMVLIVFLQLPDVVRVNRLTRSDGFLAVIGKRVPKVKLYLDRLINLIACVFMVLISVAIWPEFLDMLETRDYFGVPGIFTAPWWPVKLVIFISGVLCSTLFALKVLIPDSGDSVHSELDRNVA